MSENKWYEFTQNNSGGSFAVTDTLCHRLFIEAETLSDAIKKAESLGVYFDGCASGMDCECCGDRWSEPWKDEGIVFPFNYCDGRTFNTAEDYAQYLADEYGWTLPDARLFYSDGSVRDIVMARDQR